MPLREIHCEHGLLIAECSKCYPIFLQEVTVDDVLENRRYGKSAEWRAAADKLLLALAKENKYIVSDMLVIFLESAGFGLVDYSPLGGVFRRAMKAGIIRKVMKPTRQPLYISNSFLPPVVITGKFGKIMEGK